MTCRNGILVCFAFLNFQLTVTEAFTPCPHVSVMKHLKHTTTFSRKKTFTRISEYFSMRSRDSPSALHAIFDGKSNTESATQSVGNINQLFSRCFWISWWELQNLWQKKNFSLTVSSWTYPKRFFRWFQITLSIISAVILTFANTVRRAGSSQSLWTSGFSFSAIGVLIAFINCFWTFSSTRLTRRISLKKVEPKKIFGTLRSYAKTTVIISLIGLLVSLIGILLRELCCLVFLLVHFSKSL